MWLGRHFTKRSDCNRRHLIGYKSNGKYWFDEFKMLDSSPFGTPGAHIVVLTDGEDSRVADVENLVCDKVS